MSIDNCVEAMDQRWHVDHFKCSACNVAFADTEFIVHMGKPFCVHDFTSLYGVKVAIYIYKLCTSIVMLTHYVMLYSVVAVESKSWIIIWRFPQTSNITWNVCAVLFVRKQI